MTICTLFVLMKEAYDKAMGKREEKIEFESWFEEKKTKNIHNTHEKGLLGLNRSEYDNRTECTYCRPLKSSSSL